MFRKKSKKMDDQGLVYPPREPGEQTPPEGKQKKKILFRSKGSGGQEDKGVKKSFLKRKKKKTETEEPRQPVAAPVTGVEPGAMPPPQAKQKKGLFAKKSGAPAMGKEKKKHRVSSGTSPIGLNLGHSSIAAVRLHHNTGGSAVVAAALDRMPAGLIDEGEVIDIDGLAIAIRDFWKVHKIKGRKVNLGLASQKVVVRTLDFPILQEKELRSAIEFQAQDYIPIPIEEAVFDFHVLRYFTDEDGLQKQKVLVVAAQKTMVMDYINAIKKAKLTIDGIDLQAFAMLRAYSPRSFLDEGAPQSQAFVIVNIASDVTNLIIEANGEPQFTRITSFGGDDFTKSVQDTLGVAFSEAEIFKAQIGLALADEKAEVELEGGFTEAEPEVEGVQPEEMPPSAEGEPEGGFSPPEISPDEGPTPEDITPDRQIPEEPTEGIPQADPFFDIPSPEAEPEETPPGAMPSEGGAPEEKQFEEKYPEEQAPQGEPGGEMEAENAEDGPKELDEEEKREMVQRALEITADSFADEVRRSLDYYITQDDSLPIGRLLLGGGGSMLPNIVDYLDKAFPFPVVLGNPLVRITQNKSGLTDEELRALAPRLAIAIGLSLEDED